jgi:acyl-homoserine lactone acylase PvdQ
VTAVAVTATIALASGGAASATVGNAPADDTYPSATYVAPDYCGGQCSDILPPGENGNETLADILANKLLGTRPAHNNDQLAPYANLESSYASLTDAEIDQFYNDSSFGVPADQIESVEHPEAGVTIVRDKSTGVPHIYGLTRAATEYGAGYAGAEDRLWVMDLLRHIGTGTLTSFAGGAPANRALEQSLWRTAPYTQADLQQQVTTLENDGPRGAQLQQDITSYLDGVNAYIAQAKANRDFPGEYDLTNNANAITNAGGPQPFTETDLIAIAGVIGGLFGNGGGGEIPSALMKEAAESEYGVTEGDKVWASFREQNDPEATLTLHDGQTFDYGEAPADPQGVAMPDAGSVQPVDVVQDATGSAVPSAASAKATAAAAKQAAAKAADATKAAKASTATTAESRRPSASALNSLAGMFNDGVLPGLDMPAPGQQHPGMSNALVISAKDSTDGHPVAVFGPQTGYFAPQLLMLEELQGPGLSARGVSFAGLNFYVEIGRGPGYAWSATSGEQDIADTYAVQLCDPAGGTPTTSSDYYLDNGVCTAMDKLEVHDSWSPTLADSTPAGSYDLVTYRTAYGLVSYRGTLNGVPVAYTTQRSTYMHEADSAIGFQMFNDPSVMDSTQGFEQAASNIDFCFNWFYLNDQDTAYFNSGLLPVRAANTDPNLPMVGDAQDQWAGWDSSTYTEQDLTPSQHPNAVNQDYFVSWNNKQALGYSAADGNFSFGPVQRVDLLNNGIKQVLASGQKFDRAELVRVMETAATTDLRGSEVLPLLLQVINSQPVTDATQQQLVSELTQWQQSGAKLQQASASSETFEDAAAIQLMDAWWPLLVQNEFEPGMGQSLYQATVNVMQIDQSPADTGEQPHTGSAFQFGWYGYVSKDMRQVLGQSVTDPLARTYCGGGSLSQCRQMLLDTLTQAAAEPASQIYPGDSYCSAGDQWCADAIAQDAVGGITDPLIGWQNRPTYQQVVEFTSAPTS